MTDSTAAFLHFPILSKADFVFFRLLGPGLGNLLFPVYRAYQAQRELGGNLVFPQFMQLKIGPWLRGERDARSYGDIFAHRSLTEISQHVCALALLATNNKVRLKTYEGLGNYFHDLNPELKSDFITYLIQHYRHRDTLPDELSKISRNDICIHVRRGDFQAAEKDTSGGMNFQIEDDWYIHAAKHARSLSPRGKMRLFTDAEKLPDRLLEGVMPDEIDAAPDALQSMIKMSAHGYIVASKSSFSLWAAYLGQCRTIIHKSFDIHRYAPESTIKITRI